MRRVGRVVYGARLESVWAKARRGSNPLLSAFSGVHRSYGG